MVVVGTGLAGVSSGSSGAEPSRRCKLISEKVGRLNLRFYGKVSYVGDLAKWLSLSTYFIFTTILNLYMSCNCYVK